MEKRGFTLFELMLVAGIVMLVAVALAPHVIDAREAAQSAVCATRLRNLSQHAIFYAMNEGYFPWGGIDPAVHDENYCDDYKNMLWPRESNRPGGVRTWKVFSTFCWDFYKKIDATVWHPGVMFGTVNNAQIMGCPKCSNCSDNWDGNPFTGYNYNVAYLGYVEGDAGKRKYPTRWDAIKYPDKVVLFGDGGYAGGVNKFMRATNQDKQWDGSSASLRKAGTQAFRHGRGKFRHCNMSFADGHVEKFYTPYRAGGKVGWQDEGTHTAFISSGNGIYGPRGWGESDNYTENQ